MGEVRLSAPNKHHFAGRPRAVRAANPGEVFWAADRPYGLIEVEVRRDDEDPPAAAWADLPGFV